MPLSILQAAKYRPKAWLRAAETGSSSDSDSSSSLLLLNGNQLQWHAMALAVEDVVALSCSELPTQPSSSEVDSACGDYAADALVDAVPGERGDS